MAFTDAISSLTEDQLKEIIRARRAVPLATFLACNGKARQACALRHKYWLDSSAAWVNAMLRSINKNDFRDALGVSTLMSATESFAIGMIAKEDLDFEEYNLLISCIANVALPELIATEQTWTPEPLPKSELQARQHYESLKEKDAKGRSRHIDRSPDPDPDGDLIDTGIDPAKALAALFKKKEAPKAPESKIPKDDAIKRMLEAMKKKTAEVVSERFKVEKGSGGKYIFVNISDGTVLEQEFEKPADAIVYAARNKIKLGVSE